MTDQNGSGDDGQKKANQAQMRGQTEFPSGNDDSKCAEEIQDNRNNRHVRNRFCRGIRDWTTPISTALIAILTLFYVILSNHQWRTMLESNHINKLAYDAAYRAFIVSDGLTADLQFDPAAGRRLWTIAPNWTNSGNSPTRDMTMYVSWCPRISELDQNFTYPDLPGNKGLSGETLLGPKQSIRGLSYKIGPEVMKLVKSHQVMFYFYGWAKYKEIIDPDKPRETDFCYVIKDFLGNDPNGLQGVPIYDRCPHNCADDECKRQSQPKPADAEMCGIKIITLAPKSPEPLPHDTSPVP